MSRSREGALAFVAGRQVSQILELGEEIYDELMADRSCPAVGNSRNVIDAGQRVWLVTATPVELAQIIGRRLGLTGALGTVAENVDGVYTGRLFGELLHGQAKAAAVRPSPPARACDLRAPPTRIRSTTCRCCRWSGTGVAVNPDSALRDVARERGWQIRDFRTGRKAGQDLGADGGRRRAPGRAVLVGRTVWRKGLHRAERSWTRDAALTPAAESARNGCRRRSSSR